jgi:hypothetical protein
MLEESFYGGEELWKSKFRSICNRNLKKKRDKLSVRAFPNQKEQSPSGRESSKKI